jgi:hypothetical protein
MVALVYIVSALVPACLLIPVVVGLLVGCPRVTKRGTGFVLAAAHTIVMVVELAVAPLVIAGMRDSPYGDLYPPYLLVPGLHIYHPSSSFFGDVVFPQLLGIMDSFPASVLCVVVGPGLVGMLVGGLQWYVLGVVWDRLNRHRP